MALNQNDITAILVNVLGQNGLNIAQALQPQAQAARELSLVKVPPFYGKDDEDPHEWIEQFNHAADANNWTTDARLITIAKGYLKGAAADWARDATVQGVTNLINRWDNNNAAISFVPRFIAQFAPAIRQNKWHQELMTMRKAPIGSGQNRKPNRTEVDFWFRFRFGSRTEIEPNRSVRSETYLVIVERRILAH